ncbi:MAG: histidine phosphatase family protein, partial [Chitinophagaceae bacterium]
MKVLLLIRHAKASWDDITMKDFDRPLTERGKKDASEMA